MFNNTADKSFFLSFLLSRQPFASQLLNFLDKEDLKRLLLVSKQINKGIKTNNLLCNRIWYEQLYRIQKFLNYDFCQNRQYQQAEFQNLNSILSNPLLNFSFLTTQLKHIRNQLNYNLAKFVDTQIASQITNQIFQILNVPNFPLPRLRRENVGRFCNSSLQFFIVDNSLNQYEVEQEESHFSELKYAIFNIQQQILNSINEVKLKQVLLKVRYQGESIKQYKETSSPFLNILILIILSVEFYLQGLREIMFQALQLGENYYLFVQFNLRYNNFKNSIQQLSDKVGFLFYHFEIIFNLKLPRYQSNSMLQLWKIFIKKWLNNLSEFHFMNNKCYNYLLLVSREHNLDQIIQTQLQNHHQNQIIFDKNKQLNYLKSKKYSEIYKESYFGQSNDSLLTFLENPELHINVMLDYTEYLIDTSINELSIHWCGYTQHKLGMNYIQCQKQILETNNKFQDHLIQNFGDIKSLEYIFKEQTTFLEQKLKPVTFIKMIKETCSKINALRSYYFTNSTEYIFSNTQKQILQNLLNQDQYISFINSQRNISQNVDEEFQIFFDLSKTIQLSQLEQWINKYDNDGFEMENEDELEGYISGEEQQQDIITETELSNIMNIEELQQKSPRLKKYTSLIELEKNEKSYNIKIC